MGFSYLEVDQGKLRQLFTGENERSPEEWKAK